MVGGPGRPPDSAAGNVEPDRDVGELGADRLVLDDGAAALHAELRVFQRRLVGGAADAEVERLRTAARLRPASVRAAQAEQMSAGTRQSFSRSILPADAMIPARLRLLGHGEACGVAWHQEQRRALVGRGLDGDQLGERRVGDTVLGAVDDEVVALARRSGRDPALDRGRAAGSSRRARCPRRARGRRARDESRRRRGTPAGSARAAPPSSSANRRWPSAEVSDSTAATSASPTASSSVTMQAVSASAPTPPSSSGSASVRSPICEAWRSRSTGKLRSPASSRSALSMTGLTSSLTKSRTVSRNSICSRAQMKIVHGRPIPP